MFVDLKNYYYCCSTFDKIFTTYNWRNGVKSFKSYYTWLTILIYLTFKWIVYYYCILSKTQTLTLLYCSDILLYSSWYAFFAFRFSAHMPAIRSSVFFSIRSHTDRIARLAASSSSSSRFQAPAIRLLPGVVSTAPPPHLNPSAQTALNDAAYSRSHLSLLVTHLRITSSMRISASCRPTRASYSGLPWAVALPPVYPISS